MSNHNPTQTDEDIPTNWTARLGGALLLLGTVLSMVLGDWLADIAMGAALVGLILVLAGRGKSRARQAPG